MLFVLYICVYCYFYIFYIFHIDETDISSVTICDVGGERNERKKWPAHFIGVTAIIYVAALSSFDEKCYDDVGKNKMKEQLDVFDRYINCNDLCNKQCIWIKC